MATSYLNTGVLGQVLGGSLGTAGLGQRYQDFAAEVKRKKRTISAPTQEERAALRQRREERLAASQEELALHETNPETGQLEVVREGPKVDTADIKVPSIPVEPTAPPAVQEQQQQQNIAASQLGITKVPEVAKPAPAPAPKKIAPEKQYTQKDVAFVSAFDALYQNISSKNQSDVNKGRGTLQSQYDAALRAAQASGRAEFVTAVQGIQGIAGQKHISARNVGQAKASSQAARSAIRGLVDIDAILREQTATLNQQRVSTTVAPAVQKVVRRGRFFGGG